MSLFSTRNLRAPSADHRETLLHDRKLIQNYKLGPKSGAPPPKKKWGQNMQNFSPLYTTSGFDCEYLRNDSGYPKSESYWSRPIPPAFQETSPVNFGLPITEIYMYGPTKMHFFGYYISALRGFCALNFLHTRQIDEALLAHTLTGRVPPKYFNRENL